MMRFLTLFNGETLRVIREKINSNFNDAVSRSEAVLKPYGVNLQTLWRYSVPAGEPVYSSPAFVADFHSPTIPYTGPVVVFQGWDWHVYVVNANTGDLLWRKAFGGPAYGRPLVEDVNGDGLYEIIASSTAPEGRIYCLSHDGSTLWTQDNIYDREASGTVTSAGRWFLRDASKSWGGNTFLRGFHANINLAESSSVEILSGTGAGQVIPISGSETDGTLWLDADWVVVPDVTSTYRINPKYESDRAFMHPGSLNHEGGVWYLYVTGFDNHIMKLNAVTGAVVWKFATLENMEAYPTVLDIDGDGVLECLSACVDGYVYCLNAVSGTLKWKYAMIGGSTAYVRVADVDNDGNLEVVIAARGGWSAAPWREGGRVYVISHLGVLKNKTTTFDAFGWGDCDSAPVFLNGVDGKQDFIMANDAGIVQRTNSDCDGLWRYQVSSYVNSSPIKADINYDGADEYIICDMTGHISILSAEGDLLGSFLVKGGVEGVPLIGDFDGDGKIEIFIPTLDGYVYKSRFL